MILYIFSLAYTITKEVMKMDYPYSETGSRIWELRKKRGLTREKLSEMADISIQFLADIEKGRKSMTVATLRKLALALTTTTDYIVFGRDDSCDDTEPELKVLYSSLSPANQKRAIEMLRVFTEATNSKE